MKNIIIIILAGFVILLLVEMRQLNNNIKREKEYKAELSHVTDNAESIAIQAIDLNRSLLSKCQMLSKSYDNMSDETDDLHHLDNMYAYHLSNRSLLNLRR